MKVKDLMTADPACCHADTPLKEVARLMKEHDCGSIPVVDGKDKDRVLGIITDRDIVIRLLCEGKNPLQCTVQDAMTSPVECAKENMNLNECLKLMEEHQIRRVPVVDDSGHFCGIVAQADIAREAPAKKAAEVLHSVSQPA